MRQTEQKLWDRFRENTKRHYKGLPLREKPNYQRIENLVDTGRPDVDWLIKGVFSCVELKAVENAPVRATTRVFGPDGLSVAQRNWHMSWEQAGGKSFVLASVGKDHFLIEGVLHDYFNDMTLGQLHEAAVAFTWPQIFRALELA